MAKGGADDHRLMQQVVQMLHGVDKTMVSHALMLFALLHPTERWHRSRLLWLTALVGTGMLAAATWAVTRAVECSPYNLALLSVGSLFLGYSAVAINGKPSSIEDLGRFMSTASTALGPQQPRSAKRSEARQPPELEG
jgi:hypothetical protein